MKKSLIALAVAGVFAAPAAFAASANVDVYGIMSFAIEDTDADGVDVAVVDRVSRLGFKGSEDLGGGLKAIWQIESQLNATTNENLGNIYYSGGPVGRTALRNTFVGLAGDFGVFVLGRHDTPYKLGTGSLDIFADTMADYNGMPDGVDLIDKVHDYRTPQAIAYISPTWSGFHFAVATIATNTSINLDTTDSFDAWSATGVYSNGPLFVSGSWQQVNLSELGFDDSSAWKLGVGYTLGDLKLGAIYENVENSVLYSSVAGCSAMNVSCSTLSGLADRDSWLINAAYTMGPIVLKAEYGQKDIDGGANSDAWALGADYNLSKRTTAYAVFAQGDNDSGDDVSGWALGLKHSF